MRSLQRITRAIGRFLHPEKSGGLRGTTYAVACAILLLAFGAQSLGIIRTGGMVPSEQRSATPTVTAGPLSATDGGKAPLLPKTLVAPPRVSLLPAVSSGWYVSSFRTRDSGIDIAPIINAAGDRYGIWPVYVLAVVLAESAGYTHARRWVGSYDRSCGLMQQIVSNIAFYEGITDEEAACRWEYIPANSVWLGARILREDMDATGIGYPALWECYNAGVGSCVSPYYAGFLQNYYVALTYATNTPPIPPKRPGFPARKWRGVTGRVSQYDHGKHLRVEARLWWRGHVRAAGGVVSAPQYFKRGSRGRGSFMTTRFQGLRLFWWIHHPGWFKWELVRWIR